MNAGVKFQIMVRVRVRILSITRPDFVLVRLRIVSIFESGSESGIYQASPGPCPGPDYIRFESGYGFYIACPFPGPRPDSINTRCSQRVEEFIYSCYIFDPYLLKRPSRTITTPAIPVSISEAISLISTLRLKTNMYPAYSMLRSENKHTCIFILIGCRFKIARP